MIRGGGEVIVEIPAHTYTYLHASVYASFSHFKAPGKKDILTACLTDCPHLLPSDVLS